MPLWECRSTVPVTNKQTHCLLSTIFLLYYYQLITTKYRHRVSVIAFHSVHLQGTLTLEDEGITSLTSEGTQHRSIISQKTQLLSGLAIHQHVGKAETPEGGGALATRRSANVVVTNSKPRLQFCTSVHILYICAALTSCNDPTKTATCCASVWIQ